MQTDGHRQGTNKQTNALPGVPARLPSRAVAVLDPLPANVPRFLHAFPVQCGGATQRRATTQVLCRRHIGNPHLHLMHRLHGGPGRTAAHCKERTKPTRHPRSISNPLGPSHRLEGHGLGHLGPLSAGLPWRRGLSPWFGWQGGSGAKICHDTNASYRSADTDNEGSFIDPGIRMIQTYLGLWHHRLVQGQSPGPDEALQHPKGQESCVVRNMHLGFGGSTTLPPTLPRPHPPRHPRINQKQHAMWPCFMIRK